MKVLLTGGTGFVGGNVARALQAAGHDVRALARTGSSTLTLRDTGIETLHGDVRDRESVARAIDGCQGLVHCAALYSFWEPDPNLLYETNVTGTRTVLEEAMKAGVARCVYTSTVSTIRIPKGGVGTEENTPSQKELVGHYKRSKFLAEREALDLASKSLPVVVVNPTTPVGPWDVKPTPTGRMVLDFLRGRIPAYIETGMNLVDVEDVAVGHVLALEKGRPGERYLLGNRNLTLRQVFGLLEEVSGKKGPKIEVPPWLAMGAGYVDEFVEGKLLRRKPWIPLEGLKVSRKPMYVSCEKAMEELGMPQSSLEGALEKAIRWFRDYGYVGGTVARMMS
jgi:dihydroflavonol-4-reductase